MGVTSIPSEVLDIILGNEKLAISDVINFALTCKQIYEDVTTSNKLWKTKTLQRWAFFEKAFDNADGAEVYQINWFEEMKAQMFRRKQLKKYLTEISATNYGRLQISNSDMKVLDALLLPEIGARSANYHILMEELGLILDEDNENLSDEYYVCKIAAYITQAYVTKEWQKFLALPAKRQIIEHGMLLVTQWMQPCRRIDANKVSDGFDYLARLTRELIAEEHPDLAINRTPFAGEAEWKKEILEDNKWCPEESKIIIAALCKTLLRTLCSQIDADEHCLAEINTALFWRLNDDVSLMTVFDAVARRLGLRFEIVGYRGSKRPTALRWKERYTPEGDGNVAIYYCDIVHGGTSLVRDRFSEALDVSPEVTVFAMVIDRADQMDWECDLHQQFKRRQWSREFLHMISPRNIIYIVSLIDFYIWKGLNFGELVDSLKSIRNENEWLDPDDDIEFYEEQYRVWEEFRKAIDPSNLPIKLTKKSLLQPPKMRTPQVQYAVGMIVEDSGGIMSVITGWDATKNDKVDALTVQDLPFLRYGYRQPFYSIFCYDHSYRYVPQEELTVAEWPEEFHHVCLGRYYCKFMGRYYLPNVGTAKMYPEDVEFLNKLYER